MKKYLAIISLALFALTGCEEFQPVFTANYQEPAPYKTYTDSDFGKIITIAQLASQYTPGTPFVMPGSKSALSGDVVIKGRVSTTDQPGNFYKSLYIQDETGGIEIKIGKNGLYNDYLPGQVVYVRLEGLSLGMYGYKTGNYGGMGMVQVGFSDPTGEYETSYLEVSLLINTHIYRGDPTDIKLVEPAVITASQLPNPKTDTQMSNQYVGKLVTLKGLKYANEIFCLLYLDPTQNKKSPTNRVFLSDSNGISTYGKTHGVTTLAMSETKMTEYLLKGYWDECKVGSGKEYWTRTDGHEICVGDVEIKGEPDAQGNYSYPGIAKDAYSVSQYFTMESTEIQVRTSGYSKFCDVEIPAEVISGAKTIDITGVLTLYQGSIQLVANKLSDFVVDGQPLTK